MVRRRGGRSAPIPYRWTSIGSKIIAALAIATIWCSTVARGAENPILLSEAAEQGTFNVGAARASVTHQPDLSGGGEILRLDFTIPPGTAAGVYAKSFPGRLDPEHVDLIRVGVKVESPQPTRQIAAAIEIKGAVGVQRIPLTIQPAWTGFRRRWTGPRSGRSGRCISVSHTGDGDVAGDHLDRRPLRRLSPIRKLGMLPSVKFTGVIVASLLVAFLIGLLGRPADGLGTS